jgi:arginine N-succinyltransferase
MPPLEADRTSLLWEALGRRFTGLSYQEADRLSHQNKEFIRALFPQDPLYATLLPPNVQELIGQVGPATKGVERMLREIGFAYAGRIDPFDGGPHFHARTDDITLIRAVGRARLASAPPTQGMSGRALLVGRERAQAPHLRAVRALGWISPNDGTLALPADVVRLLELAPGDEVAFLPLSTPAAAA